MVDQPSNTIASFRGLQGNQARAQFLHDLISELSPYERRGLKEVLNKETHQIDIISSLPLELFHIVLQYLDVSELFSLRRVSRRWLHRLASPDVCRTILRRDFPEETTFVDSNDLDPATRLFSKAQQRHAFRTGRPYSKASFPIKVSSVSIPPPQSITPAYLLDYHDGKLVGVDCSSGTAIAHTLNLMNGRDFSLVPGNRERINQVKISDTLVAVITTLGICHVYDHRTEEGHFFHLPSLPAVRMSVAARHIAVVGLPAKAGFASVLLRNFDTQKSSFVNVIFDSGSNVQAVVLHPRGDAFYLTTTGQLRCPSDEPDRSFTARIEILKFNFQGEMMFKRECWTESEFISDPCNRSLGPTVSGNHCNIDLGTDQRELYLEKSGVVENHYIDYDMESEKVVYEKSARRVEPEDGESTCLGHLRQNMRWEETTYFARYSRRRYSRLRLESILVQNVHDSSSARKTEILDIDTNANSEKRSDRIMRHGNIKENYWLVGDERFLVLIDGGEVWVYCFEEDLVMPGEELHYRAERMRRAEMRAAERRLHAMKT